ncbi:hypothetical protein FOA52_000870 [Chlamydomonas sp. UWO 241]|nr:hypothetical protein FOA52_000870 [Chlamydomonas sp. UWO 241]
MRSVSQPTTGGGLLRRPSTVCFPAGHAASPIPHAASLRAKQQLAPCGVIAPWSKAVEVTVGRSRMQEPLRCAVADAPSTSAMLPPSDAKQSVHGELQQELAVIEARIAEAAATLRAQREARACAKKKAASACRVASAIPAPPPAHAAVSAPAAPFAHAPPRVPADSSTSGSAMESLDTPFSGCASSSPCGSCATKTPFSRAQAAPAAPASTAPQVHEEVSRAGASESPSAADAGTTSRQEKQQPLRRKHTQYAVLHSAVRRCCRSAVLLAAAMYAALKAAPDSLLPSLLQSTTGVLLSSTAVALAGLAAALALSGAAMLAASALRSIASLTVAAVDLVAISGSTTASGSRAVGASRSVEGAVGGAVDGGARSGGVDAVDGMEVVREALREASAAAARARESLDNSVSGVEPLMTARLTRPTAVATALAVAATVPGQLWRAHVGGMARAAARAAAATQVEHHRVSERQPAAVVVGSGEAAAHGSPTLLPWLRDAMEECRFALLLASGAPPPFAVDAFMGRVVFEFIAFVADEW